MRSSLFLAAIAPVLVAAAPLEAAPSPPTAPKITTLVFSGTGCPNNSGSVKSNTGLLDENISFSFGQLTGDSTDNCQVHLQSSGGTAGWQVAIKDVEYKGHLKLKPGTTLDTFTTVFWSEKAAQTGSLNGEIVCGATSIDDDFTLKQTTTAPVWSKCTASDGYPGTLNVNHRPLIQGTAGSYDIKSATWHLVWRKC